MKKLLLILLYLPMIGFGQGTLIFSEYGEGSSFNKWIEIYNPTSQNISLDDYRYNFCWNGCNNLNWEFSLEFDSGYILPSGETYLVVHYDASSNLLNAADQTSNLLSNGNDVIGLFNTSLNTIVDIIGVFDSTGVSTGWDVDGTINATQDHTMIRAPEVCAGNMGDWSISDGSSTTSEWIVGLIEDYTNLNLHNSDCFNTTSIPIAVPKPLKSNIVKITDILGRETKQTNQPLLYLYDDGTVKKKITIE